MKLAIFDLDNTLLDGDSDYLWGVYLCQHGYIDDKIHGEAHKRYYDDYRSGRLDILDFLEFQLQPLAGVDLDILHARRTEYIEEKIRPIILEKARRLISDHRQNAHEILIITATNDFLTRPIADLLEVEHLIASEAEIVNSRYTGKPAGVPSFSEGKVIRYQQWLDSHHYSPEETWFYSDSHNDLPLLRAVDNPVAVDPDEILKKEAELHHWPVISLR